MRTAALFLTTALCAIAAPTDDFIAAAALKHGAFGEKAARFLVEHMPPSDKETLTTKFLTENLDLAMKARTDFPWAKDVPEEIFLNDVLPYAVFDEPRDAWRSDFLAKAAPLVKDQKITTEIEGRTISLTGDVPPGTQILLSDKLIGLEEPLEISVNGKAPFTAKPVRTLGAIRSALKERLDPAATPTAVITCP